MLFIFAGFRIGENRAKVTGKISASKVFAIVVDGQCSKTEKKRTLQVKKSATVTKINIPELICLYR